MRGLAALTLAATMMTGAAAGQGPAPVLPEIMLSPSDGMVTVEGVVTGTGSAEVTATLSISHQGSGGKMTTRQARDLVLDAGSHRVSVARTALNFGPESALSVDLVVTVGETVVARSRVNIGSGD